MLKNRDITVRIGKKVNEETEVGEQTVEAEPLEDKVHRVVQVLEGPAKKVFFCICAYVVLDTIRQVQVAKASNPTR